MSPVYIVVLLSVVMTTSARSYYDAIVVDAEGRSDEKGAVRRRTVSPEDCHKPPSSGPCRALFPAFYFNTQSGRCETFTWSGCGGNSNRFETRASCEKNCPVRKEKRSGEQLAKRCNRDVVPPACSKGCRLTKDSDNCPKCDCSTHKSVCSLPAVRGHCRALLPRWRYDPSTGKCTEFKFGGCDGNGNNFRTEQQCMKICAGS
ncbi:kunitz-type U19-barytoxin-Tl1a [Cryptotermes secundus]|uniref:kunitz-type U19-barytoxin-Tl1a n=1 Tax=Cryptotermes secundus TaxID=105785 RepID=UPI000CD7B0A5|nr:kunitz-type U19-barytoxin-Tl1a [Cryptotermes secundus]